MFEFNSFVESSKNNDRFTVRQVNSVDHLTQNLDVDRRSPEMAEKLDLLFDAVKRMGKNLFVVESNLGKMVVIADSENAIETLKIELANIDGVQNRFRPEGLQHACAEMSKFAVLINLADGILDASYESVQPNIYPANGAHFINYKDVPQRRATINFDLTAKRYIFTSNSGKVHANALIMIDELHSMNGPENIYRRNWVRKSYDRKQQNVDYLIHQIGKKLK